MVQPIKLQRMKRTNCWQPARRVWFQKNDDSKKGYKELYEEERRKGHSEEEAGYKAAMKRLGHKND